MGEIQVEKVYLDTCVISNFVRSDMKRPTDGHALTQITTFVKSGSLTLYSSTVAREEIDKIPTEFRGNHLDKYSTLEIVRGSTAWLGENNRTLDDHHDFQTLSKILRDRNDARQIWLAIQAGIKNFVTTDEKTILSKSSKLRKCGINVYSPSSFVNMFSK